MWEQECVLAVYLKQRYERVRLWKEHRKICIMNTSSQLSCVTSLIALRLCIQSAYLLVLLNLVQYVRCVRYLKHFSHRIVKRVSFCEASGLGNYWKWMCCPVLGSLEAEISMETSGQHTLLIYEEVLRGVSLCQQRCSLYIFTHHKQDLQYFRAPQTNTISRWGRATFINARNEHLQCERQNLKCQHTLMTTYIR